MTLNSKVKIIAVILLFIPFFSKAQESNCQFYNLILNDIRNSYMYDQGDSIPKGQLIDPVNPEKTKSFTVHSSTYLDFYVSPKLFELNPIDLNRWLSEFLHENGNLAKCIKVDNPSIENCITDSIIRTRFLESKTQINFDNSYFRKAIVNNKTVLFNPIYVVFSNVLYLKDGSAIVYVDTKLAMNPGRISYGYILNRKNKQWVIKKRIIRDI
jgi:hypothetical protein